MLSLVAECHYLNGLQKARTIPQLNLIPELNKKMESSKWKASIKNAE